MNISNLTKIEKQFFELSKIEHISTKIPYIVVENFPKLGFLASLRFLEWVSKNPTGVISLPTGKTPEYFIKWTKYIIDNWNTKRVEDIRTRYNLLVDKKPELVGLQFVQIDEFYPISSKQHNSFFDYVNNFYINGFGLDIKKSLLINSDEIPLADNKHFSQIFPNNKVDLSLRYRDCRSENEKVQQKSIFMIDDWCTEYEHKIREKGGIGFFLGGIGPDGHIAFNTRGSDHYSTTRLTTTNFETQAVSAGDLGGIEIAKNRLVITIGLETITYNPEAVAIIIAAGESKAEVVKNALESEASNLYPATAIHKLKNSRFYLTKGAASQLTDTIENYYKGSEWTFEKTERSVINLCKRINKYGDKVVLSDLKSDPYCSLIPDLNKNTLSEVVDSIKKKLAKGLVQERDQAFLHTGPHHDDIMLGIMPQINRQLRSATNTLHFSILTSGFTAVTNSFIIDVLIDTKKFLCNGQIEMINYPDFFESGYRFKRDKDVYHFLNKVAAADPNGCRRGLCHRIVRSIVEIYQAQSKADLIERIDEILDTLKTSYDGEKNPPRIQLLKGMVREFEEELVWAHFGVQVKNVHHLRLGFYTGDIFTEQPDKERDVQPILKMLKELRPTVISLALDPEGSGPDTHYKVLQAIAAAIREWQKEEDLKDLRIWGYRNVWYKFHPADVNVIAPVSLNSLALLNSSFSNCYLSQVEASFPSYLLDGKFSDLTQKTWVDQLRDIQFLLGKDFFYQNQLPLIRATHGLLFFKEMNIDEFLLQARELEKSMEGVV